MAQDRTTSPHMSKTISYCWTFRLFPVSVVTSDVIFLRWASDYVLGLNSWAGSKVTGRCIICQGSDHSPPLPLERLHQGALPGPGQCLCLLSHLSPSPPHLAKWGSWYKCSSSLPFPSLLLICHVAPRLYNCGVEEAPGRGDAPQMCRECWCRERESLRAARGWSRGFPTPCPASLVSEDVTLFIIFLPNSTEISLPQLSVGSLTLHDDLGALLLF